MNSLKNTNKFIKELESNLNENLFDQVLAVEMIVKNLAKTYLLETNNKVQSFFTFIGPANSGKHYCCELLEKINPKIENIKTFYMEQYSGSISSDQQIVIDFNNEVIDFVQNNPKAILVFEDIEKADLQVQLSIYTLFTNYDKSEIDFSNIVAIVTTTALSSLLQRKDLQILLKDEPLQAHTFLMEHLAKEQISFGDAFDIAFDRKLLSFLNEHTVVVFKRLNLKALIKIAGNSLQNMSQEFIEKSGVNLEFIEIEDVVSLLTLSLSPYINTRYIKQMIPKLMFNHIYDDLKIDDNTTQISYQVSKKAKQFLQKILKDEEQFLLKVTKQHKRISLNIDSSISDGKVECIIKDAFYVEEKLTVETHEAMHISDIKFKDVVGHKKVKEELNEILTLIKEPKKLKRFDLSVPKGMFLYGPAGIGKKLIARAFAGEANIPYIVINGSDLFNKTNIHNAYIQAYSSAPAIIILEDIDIPGILNGVISTMSLEPVMEELDKLQQSFESPIFTIITLSSNANISADLLQSNRIAIHIEVPKLDMETRRFFIQDVLKKPHDKNIDIERVVRYISGMGGNELKRIGQEASLYAARKGLKELTEEILLEQINIIKYGTKLENKQIRDIETSMSKTAYHEAGHAVLSSVLLPNIKIEQVTVSPRSEALGFVSYHNEEYIDATTKEELFNDVCVLLAGRISEMQKYGTDGMESGAVNDLEIATTQVYAAIALFGMDEKLGYINVAGLESVSAKPILSEKIEERILVWIDEATKNTQKEVKRLWKAIDAVALALIEKEMIDGEELKSIIEENILL